MRQYVAYYRVSTEKQGRSGLGLEAQKAAVAAFTSGTAPIAELTEIESGKNNDRPQLAAALRQCRLTGAKLIVAKLDRLSRNMAFLAALMDADVEFVAVDNPHANRLTIHILAALAEHERAMISTRTKDALAAAKRRGVKLGGRRHAVEAYAAKASLVAARLRTERARAKAKDLAGAIDDVRAKLGADASLRAIADELNARNVLSPRGAPVTAATVQRAAIAARTQ